MCKSSKPFFVNSIFERFKHCSPVAWHISHQTESEIKNKTVTVFFNYPHGGNIDNRTHDFTNFAWYKIDWYLQKHYSSL